jgi:HK97 family phage portal protein
VSFWSHLLGSGVGSKPNANSPSTPATVGGGDYTPGDPHGVVVDQTAETVTRSLPVPLPSGWDGWPASWSVPQWDFGSRFNELVDVAWTCLDLNSSVLSAMPVYQTSGGQVVKPTTWMANPDPTIYTSYHEFAKQLFWDYMLGEGFVLPVSRSISTGYPLTFRVCPPWMMHVEMKDGIRRVRLGGPAGPDVTDEVLHIRYKSTTDSAHGVGPLESAGGRMLTAGVLAKYVRTIVDTGGVPAYTLETDQPLSADEAQDLLNQWVASRAANLGAPPVLDNNVSLKTHQAMTPKDMAMLELTEFTESRIAVLLGVPPYLVSLSGPANSSVPYANVQQLFDFHDRASLKTKATHVMAALSWWALPRGTCVELNRDEYTRPAFAERAAAWVQLIAAGAVSIEEFRTAERLSGPAPVVALTGGMNEPETQEYSVERNPVT